MKFSVVILVVAFASNLAAAASRDLGDVMSDMAGVAKAISKQISSREQNADSAAKTETLRDLIVECLPIEPHKVAEITDKTARKVEFLEYQKAMAALYAASSELEQSFLNNDNDQAQKTFAQIRDLQSKGHGRFREDHK